MKRPQWLGPEPCALCGRAHSGRSQGYYSETFAKHLAPERAGFPETALVCNGCRNGFEYALSVAPPKMSAETFREIARIAAGFLGRVARANHKLALKSGTLYAAKGSIPSPRFQMTLEEGPSGKLLPKLLKLGATPDQIKMRTGGAP